MGGLDVLSLHFFSLACDATATPMTTIADPIRIRAVIGSFIKNTPSNKATKKAPANKESDGTR